MGHVREITEIKNNQKEQRMPPLLLLKPSARETLSSPVPLSLENERRVVMHKSKRSWHNHSGAGAAAIAASLEGPPILGASTRARPRPKQGARQDRRARKRVALAVKGMRYRGLVAGPHYLLHATGLQKVPLYFFTFVDTVLCIGGRAGG